MGLTRVFICVLCVCVRACVRVRACVCYGTPAYPLAFLPVPAVAYSLKARGEPIFAMVSLIQGQMQVIFRHTGYVSSASLLGQLVVAMEQAQPALVAEQAERDQRDVDRTIRKEQNQAFEESLRIDREKVEPLACGPWTPSCRLDRKRVAGAVRLALGTARLYRPSLCFLVHGATRAVATRRTRVLVRASQWVGVRPDTRHAHAYHQAEQEAEAVRQAAAEEARKITEQQEAERAVLERQLALEAKKLALPAEPAQVRWRARLQDGGGTRALVCVAGRRGRHTPGMLRCCGRAAREA